jgi:hypothetical protein
MQCSSTFCGKGHEGGRNAAAAEGKGRTAAKSKHHIFAMFQMFPESMMPTISGSCSLMTDIVLVSAEQYFRQNNVPCKLRNGRGNVSTKLILRSGGSDSHDEGGSVHAQQLSSLLHVWHYEASRRPLQGYFKVRY